MSGFIKKVYVRNGEYVEAGSPVMEVAQNRRLYITAELQPSKYHALRDIVSTNFKTASGSEVYSVADLNGSLVSYGRSVDEENPLVQSHRRFLPPDSAPTCCCQPILRCQL